MAVNVRGNQPMTGGLGRSQVPQNLSISRINGPYAITIARRSDFKRAVTSEVNERVSDRCRRANFVGGLGIGGPAPAAPDRRAGGVEQSKNVGGIEQHLRAGRSEE